jgi:hypothetical protein
MRYASATSCTCQVAQFLHEAQLEIQLVQNRHFLQGGNRWVGEKLLQLRAAIPCGKKIIELMIDGDCIELGRGHHIKKCAGVTGDKSCH